MMCVYLTIESILILLEDTYWMIRAHLLVCFSIIIRYSLDADPEGTWINGDKVTGLWPPFLLVFLFYFHTTIQIGYICRSITIVIGYRKITNSLVYTICAHVNIRNIFVFLIEMWFVLWSRNKLFLFLFFFFFEDNFQLREVNLSRPFFKPKFLNFRKNIFLLFFINYNG